MKSVFELASLKGRRAIVTGGSGHIGRAICTSLAEVGADIALVDKDGTNVRTRAGEISNAYGVKAVGMECDLSDEIALLALPNQVVKILGGIDIIVNCAAFVGTSDLKGWTTAFERQDFGTWRQALEVNLTAPVELIQACVPELRKSGRSSVINIGSTYGVGGADWSLYEGTGMGQPAAYAASKGGLIQMTRWLATALAPEIRINAISPGGVWRDQPDSFHRKYVSRTPLGRMATEEDFLGAVLYFASDLSAYVTGQNLMVDGGWTAW